MAVRLDVPLLDEYLEFLAGRCRPNTVLAGAHGPKGFFTPGGEAARGGRPRATRARLSRQESGGGTGPEHRRARRTTWNGSITATASGSSSLVAGLETGEPVHRNHLDAVAPGRVSLVLIAAACVAPAVLVDADHAHAVEPVRVLDQHTPALGQHSVVRGVPRHAEALGDPSDGQGLTHDAF